MKTVVCDDPTFESDDEKLDLAKLFIQYKVF